MLSIFGTSTIDETLLEERINPMKGLAMVASLKFEEDIPVFQKMVHWMGKGFFGEGFKFGLDDDLEPINVFSYPLNEPFMIKLTLDTPNGIKVELTDPPGSEWEYSNEYTPEEYDRRLKELFLEVRRYYDEHGEDSYGAPSDNVS